MNNVKIYALGGFDELGKNMYCIEVDEDLFIVHAGVKSPENNDFGVEYIIPDVKYLKDKLDRLKGIIITHCHKECLGAIPYLLKYFNTTIYAPKFSTDIIKIICKNNGIQNLDLVEIGRYDQIKVGNSVLKTFGLTHMSPDAVGVSLSTPYGNIVIAEKFVIDFDMHEKSFDTDIGAIADIGKEGVLALMLEASYSNVDNFTAPRHRVTNLIRPIFEEAKQRIIVTVYDKNIFRIKEIIKLAAENKKKVYFYDHTITEMFKIMEENGYYKMPKDILVDNFSNNVDNIVVIVTGQGSSIFDLMNKIAINEDEKIELRPSDVIIIASPIVPGTEKKASMMENELYKDNVKIIKLNKTDVLAMHPAKEDMKMMMYLLKPKYFIPTMGEYIDFMNGADLAIETGFTPDKIIILDNGQIALFEDGKLKSTSDIIETGDVMIGDSDNKDIASFVLKDRETLSTDGVIVIGIVINHSTKKIYSGPDIQSRGVIYLKESEYVIKNIGKMTVDMLKEKENDQDFNNLNVRSELREMVSKYIFKETGKKPMVIPAILEINS